MDAVWPGAPVGGAGVRREMTRSRRAGTLVAHVVPAPFDPEDGIVGGAERYSFELARHMAERVPTRLVTFGNRERCMRTGRLDVRVLKGRYVRGQRTNPIAATLASALGDAGVVHCHQQHVLAASTAAVLARLRRQRVFATDLGGGGWDLSSYVSTDRLFHGHLHISAYSRRVAGHGDSARAQVILGGVDVERFSPGQGPHDAVLFVGRVLPHKGIHDLIDAVPADLPLRVIGRAMDAAYLEQLRARAAGKDVTFLHDVPDDQLAEEYRRALCVVLPSVYTTPDGNSTRVPELLGQTLLEAMASGRPAICTDVGAMPEIVANGRTGFVVPPNDPPAIADAIAVLRADPGRATGMGREGRARVLDAFRWEQVVERCLEAYATL